MISEINIENFKSVEKLTLPLGRVNVFIGENGSGKSNILEAITFLGAAVANKLDNEFLASRGIRVTEPEFMCSAFPNSERPSDAIPTIKFSAKNGNSQIETTIQAAIGGDEKKFNRSWGVVERAPVEVASKITSAKEFKETAERIKKIILAEDPSGFLPEFDVQEHLSRPDSDDIIASVIYTLGKMYSNQEANKKMHLSDFLVYSPENSALRTFEEEGQILPLGIRGQGLFKLLQYFSSDKMSKELAELKHSMELTGWFLDFYVPKNLASGEYRLIIKDRYLRSKAELDHRSANEGFLFLLFYFATLLSPDTPQFFAIDNIDASLNPKLCAKLMEQISLLSKNNNKQIILTTHNPSILDGLDLTDMESRLFVIFRDEDGRTRARRVPAPNLPMKGKAPMKLSAAFTAGHLGGLPKNF